MEISCINLILYTATYKRDEQEHKASQQVQQILGKLAKLLKIVIAGDTVQQTRFMS